MKENDCLFFEKVNAGKAWEPGCRLRNYYCSCGFDDNSGCEFCVKRSERNKVASILGVCVEALGFVIPPEQEDKQ